ncbi:GspE/PulE family protein [Thermoproteota archaeon]
MEQGRLNIYDIIRKTNLISQSRLDQAATIAEEQGFSLYQVLIEQDFVTEKAFLETIAPYLNLPFEIIDKGTIDYHTSSLIPEEFSRQHMLLPLFQLGDILTVAITNPFDLQALEEIELITHLTVNPLLTSRNSIESLMAYVYSYQEAQAEDVTSMSNLYEMSVKLVEDRSGSEDEIYDLAQEAPIAKLVDTVIRQAIAEKASDIHVEPEENVVKIRYRVDGLLKDVMTPPKKLETAIISRIKILANLDITETRKPQDGRITISLKDRDVDFRVSSIRTITGEKIVLRILDKTGAFVSLEKLGLSEPDYLKIIAMISATSGIIISCGPTGSGKTSTLYSCLSKINTSEKNIITIEDPVEYNLEGINQIPVNAKIGVDFVKGLASIVRQDPDVIMVGEVRNVETANIAIQAALTGHLVFTTLHTRNAPGTVARLLDMGAQPFLLNSSIIGVIGQRLVRTICPSCKKPIPVESYTEYKQKEIIKRLVDLQGGKEIKPYKGEGCKFCDGTGYKGRTGIFEIMTLDEPIRELILQKSSSTKIMDVAIAGGMTTMIQDGLNKIINGLTTIDEIARVLDL